MNPIFIYLNQIKIEPVESYLEIGISDGFTLSYAIKGWNLKHIVLCDTWGKESGGTGRGNHNHIEVLLRELNFKGNVTFLDGDSKKLVPKYFDENPDVFFDFIFVDGDHSPEGVQLDLDNTIEHGRIIAVHDLRNPSHPYILNIFYEYYETIRGNYIMIDDGYYMGYFIERKQHEPPNT